ncbi:hypothetical protein PIB30_013190 [Stylosanthes scabra]|uniref:Uncharacterized protein n=1 Tax=Stylosanthes scabra TaxID=79078 RepID=A0ABU6Z3V7_9FABA|nr:hypothetical protein [Stylosanthes scabra]
MVKHSTYPVICAIVKPFRIGRSDRKIDPDTKTGTETLEISIVFLPETGTKNPVLVPEFQYFQYLQFGGTVYLVSASATSTLLTRNPSSSNTRLRRQQQQIRRLECGIPTPERTIAEGSSSKRGISFSCTVLRVVRVSAVSVVVGTHGFKPILCLANRFLLLSLMISLSPHLTMLPPASSCRHRAMSPPVSSAVTVLRRLRLSPPVSSSRDVASLVPLPRCRHWFVLGSLLALASPKLFVRRFALAHLFF